MKPLFSAIKFLTIIPIPETWAGKENELVKSVLFYPIVGLILGMCLILGQVILSGFLPDALVVIGLICLSTLLTGALHLDGLADTADGFFSSRPRERMLEIMKDSHTGVMGATGVIFLLVIKGTALFYIPESIRWQILLLFPVAGRSSLLLHWSILGYARKEGGIASIFNKKYIIRAAAAGVIVCAGMSWIISGGNGILAFVLTLLYTAVISIYVHRKIGGMTGDTLGAVCETSEVMFLIGMVSFYS